MYDKYGNLTKQSLPYTGNTPSLWNNYSYDNYDRLVSVIEASGRTASYQYSQNSVTTTEDEIARTKTYNSLGQLISVTDPAGTISYKLHADGQPMEIVSPGNIVTTLAYDEYRRRTSFTDPSLGKTEYEYDQSGNLIKETNANGQTSTNEYDSFNRIVKKTTPEFSTSYTYNSRNELINIVSDNGTSSSFTFDNYGRIVSSRECVQDGKWLQKELLYSAGKPSSIKYTSQSGALVKENFEYVNSYLVNVKLDDGTLVYKLSKENALGIPTEIMTGGVTREYGFDNYGMPTYRKASIDANVIQDISLSFDKNTRNLLSRKDRKQKLEELFSYDNLNRLSGYGNELVEYDNNGNITKKSDIGTYDYSLPSKPYAVTGLSANSTASISSQDVTYYSFFRPNSILEDGYLAQLFYNSEYDRTKMTISKNGQLQSTKYYIAGNYELEETPSGSVERVYLRGDYYSSPVVYVKNNGQAGVLYNIIRDHLGSISHIAKINGDVIQELSYDVWGRLRNPNTYAVYEKDQAPSLLIGRGFTGHEHLEDFCLINMNARLYDASLGRFLSPDPYVQMPDASQSFNRYSYSMNNPLCYVDENGEFWHLTIGAVIGGVVNWASHGFKFNAKGLGYFATGAVAGAVGAGVGAGISSAMAGGSFSAGFWGTTAAKTVATSFVSGAAIGGTGGFASGFTTGFGNSVIEKNGLGNALLSGLKGGMIGGLSGAVVGGLWNGIDAAIDGRDFLSGETWQTITEYSLPHGDLPIHQQTNPEVGCTQETLESISDYLGNPVSVADKSQGADFAQLAKEYGFKTTTIMPQTINSEHIVGAQMTLGNPAAITYNNGGVMHTVGLNRIKIQQIHRLLSSGVRTRINIQVMDPLHKTLQRLPYRLFNNGYIRIVTP